MGLLTNMFPISASFLIKAQQMTICYWIKKKLPQPDDVIFFLKKALITQSKSINKI